MSRRRVLFVSLAAVVLACCSGLAFAATRSAAPERTPPSRAELYRLQDRIDKRWDELARQGIFIQSTGHPAELCLSVGLANPTPANIAYLRGRFGPDVCVERKPEGRHEVCAGYVPAPLPEGPVTVPDLRDLGLREASRRLIAGGLTYAADCLGERERRVLRITRGSPTDLARVFKQCPHAGQRVPAGTEVGLHAAAVLPGRFRYEVGALSVRVTGTRTTKLCQDGRHVSSPSETALQAPTSHDGHARIRATAKVVTGTDVRFTVGCPAGTNLNCQGTARLSTKAQVATADGRRRLTIAVAGFERLAPGETRVLTVPMRSDARRYVRNRRTTPALGVVQNHLADGMVETTSQVEIRNRGDRG